MANATDIARIGTLPDGAFLPDGTGNTNVKSLKGMTEQSIKDSIGMPIGGAFGFAKDGLIGLLGNLVGDLLGTVGDILKGGLKMGAIIVGGVIEVGSAIIGGAINAVGDLFGWVGSGIVSLFNRKAPAKPLPPVFSEIRVDLEEEIAPFLESVEKGQENARLALEEADALKIELGERMAQVNTDIALANDLIEAVGDVDQKIADQAAIHIRDAEAALGEAQAAHQALTAYKELVDPQIQSALTDSRAGLARLDTLEPEIESVTTDLATYKTATDGKIQEALDDSRAGIERLEVLEPKVSTAISDLAAYEEATNAQIQDLLGKANGAISDAGQALTQYDALLEQHESFKTDAAGKLEALNTLTGQQQETINNAVTGSVIEYAVGSSETTAPTTGWSTDTPTRAAGRFTWMRTKVTYGSGQVVTTSAALITGNTGTPGTDGTPGKDGMGLKSTTVTYATSTSGATAPTTGWTAAVPTLTKGRYLWTKTLWTYTDDSTETGYSVAYVAKDGSNGTDGLPGKDGVGITGTEITYAASSSGTVAPTSGWVASPPAGTPGQFIWTKTVWSYSDNTTETGYTVGKIGNTGAKGDTGAKGADGIPGKDGVGLSATLVEYVLHTSGTIAPASGWSTTVPTLTKGRYLWTRTTWTYTDDSTETGHSVAYIAKDGSNGTDGLPGKDGVGITSTTITYAASSSGTTPPTSGWVASPPAGTPGQFIWTRTVWGYSDNTSETGYSVGKIGNTGAKGDQGIQGVPGAKGADGQTTYTWIKYADSASGVGLSDSPVGKTYIGFAYNKTTATESTVASDYTWSLIQGPQGDQGVPGAKGADGQTTYTWIKYSDSASGTSPYDVPKASTKYIGIAVNKTTATESTNPADYTWSLFKGEDGVGISATEVTYASSTSGTTTPTSWSSTIPSVTAGRFLWTRTVTSYTDGTSTTSYSVARQGANGANGTPGAAGADGLTSYFHTAYATNATGTTGFSTTDPNGKTYVGTYSDFTEADSTDPAKYTWQLVKGADGADGKGVKTSVVTYAASASGTTAPTSGWASTIPTVAQGSYLWTRTVTTFTDGATTTVATPSRQGVDGAKGADGLPGKDGVGVKTTAITYALSTSGTTAPSSGWAATVPTLTKGRYLWTRTVWTYTDDSTETGHSVSYIPTNGSNGTDGLPGKDGVGITGTAITYAKSSSGTSAPTTGWVDQPPATSPGDFMWTKTVWTYSDNTTETGYTVGKIGNAGAQGAKGDTGAKGATGAKGDTGDQGISVTSVTSYYRLVTRGATTPAKPTVANPSTAEWSLTEPAFEANRELYRADKVTYSNGTFAWTDVSKVSAYTASTEAMNTAVDALAGVFNSTDIGSSLVAYIPGTSTPVWADTMTPATPEENPQGLPEAYVFTSMRNTLPMPNSISVNPGIDYKVSVWLKADKPGSKMHFEIRDQDSVHAVRSGSIGGGGTYLINNLTLPTEWTLYETVLTFHPGVKRIYMSRRYANHSNGTERNAVQYMADLRIDPVTVTPADVTNTVNVVAESLNNYRTTNDQAVSDANKAAQAASGIATSKGEVIYQATAPTGARASAANLWIRTSDNAPHTYDGSKWVAVTDKVAVDAAKAASDANNLAKSKTTTYYQTTAPAASVSVVGDLWIDQSTAGKNTLKRWSGSAWVAVQDKAIAEAMAAAGTAQSTADGKVRTFAQTSAPTGVASKDAGDLWIDTDDGNKLYRWSGSSWISLQDKGIVSALNLAQQGVDDAKAVANKIPALDNRLKDLSTDQETIGGKAQQGIDDAKYAADLVRNSVDIGTSLVALIPGTNRPRWSEGIEEVTVTDLPGVTVAYKAPSTQQTVNPSVQWVKADPKVKYHVSFWAKASAPGSLFYIHFDNQDETRAPISNTLPGGSTSLLANFEFPTEWTKYEGVIQLRDTTERVRFRTMFWNHHNGIKADQYLADFRVEPIIPSQDDVNKLLIDTAQNHDDILKAQAEINDIHDGKWKDQSALNAMQLEIDENQNTAIQGLTASTMLAFPHMNVAPNDNDGRPWWAVGMDRNSTYTPPGFPSGPSYHTSRSDISNVNPEAMITVVPGIDYKLEFWTARVDAGTAGAYTDVRNESGKTVLTHWADVTDGIPTEISWSARNYAGDGLGVSSDWIRKVYLLRVQPGTNKMALHFRPGSTATNNGTRVRFWGAHLSAFMPIQERLDAAQTAAILANSKIDDSQDGLIAANNKAIAATTEAVSAHQRILQVAYPDSGSAIPMVPGGVNVGTADAPVYEAMPEWLHAYGVTKVTGTAGMEDKRAAHANTTKRVTVTNPTKVKVNPTALYRYSFWIQASAAGSEAYIRLCDQNGAGAVLENIPDAGMPTPRTSGSHLFWFNGNVPFTNGWNKISGVIRLNPDVTHVYIDGVGLNHQGTITNQWLADIQLAAIIPSQSDVNKALADVNAAQTAILSGHQDVLDMAFPNTSLVPMTNGVPEWTSTVSANPIRTPEGNWRFTSATAIQPGTGGKHVPTVNEVTYRAIVRLRRTGSGGTFGIRLRGAGSTSSITNLTAVTDKPAPAGASRTNFLTTNQTVGTDWTTWYFDFTLPNNTGDVRVGYVVGSTGVEVSQLSVVALLPDQSEYNRINNEINDTQNDVLHDHQRALDLMNPAENIVPMVPGGLNVGTGSAPKYVHLPWWINDSRYQTFSEDSLPGGNRVAVVENAQRIPSIGGDYFPVTPGGEYRYEFFFKAPVANSGLVIYLVGKDGSAAFQSSTPDNLDYGNTSGHLWWSGTMPGGTGPEVGGFYKITGKVKFRDNVTQAKINRIYYNWSGGAVTSEQTITGLRIWPDVPSQLQVNEGFSTAIEANTKAISLAFPDRNLDPQTSAGRPQWSTSVGVTIDTTGSFGGYTPTYKLAGATTGGYMDFQSDIREYRFRAMISPGTGSSVSFNLSMQNPSGQDMVEAWRMTFPPVDSREEYLSEAGEMSWTAGTTVTATLANGLVGQPGEWGEIDVVIRLKAGENRGRLQLSAPTTTNNWVLLYNPRLTMFSASQWQVDYAQNKALDGLSRAIELQGRIDDKIKEAIGENGLGGVVEDLESLIDEMRTFIPRTMVMNFNSTVPRYDNPHFRVYNNDNSIDVEALGTWTGRAVLTYVYGSSHETAIEEFKVPDTDGSRRKVRSTQPRTWRRMARLDYWIDQGEQGLSTKKETVNASVGTDWTTRSALTFTVEDSVSHQIRYDAVWPQTSRNNKSWGLRIKRNGTVIKTLTQKDIGPRWPWEDGKRSQEITWKGGLTKGDTITFEVYTGSNNTSEQRKLESAERRISWIRKTS